MTHSKLFIAGLPGTGKSGFGNFLVNNYGFVHFDLENDVWPQPKLRPIWEKSRSDFIANIQGQKVVLNWGFPVYYSDWVKEIVDNGFAFIWFTGKVGCAKKWYLKRENGLNEERFENQVKAIKNNNYPSSLERNLLEINVFKGDCEFEDCEDILKLINEKFE